MRFRFLDRIVSFDPAGRIVTLKGFSRTEDYVGGPFHSSGVPSSLVLETIAVSGGSLIDAATEHKVIGLLLRVEEATFFAPVVAGDQVEVRSEMLGIQDRKGQSIGLARTLGTALVGGKKVAEAKIVYLCLPADKFRTGSGSNGNERQE